MLYGTTEPVLAHFRIALSIALQLGTSLRDKMYGMMCAVPMLRPFFLMGLLLPMSDLMGISVFSVLGLYLLGFGGGGLGYSIC